MAKKPSAPAQPRVEVLTNRYGKDRVGSNLEETSLIQSNVRLKDFGKLFTRPVDGDLYAQPLIANDLVISGRKYASVVFLATSRDTVYAYDAEDPYENLPLWQTNLGSILNPPRLPVPRDAIFPGYLNFNSEVGITSTPVIDRDGKGGIIYVVAKTVARLDSKKTWADSDFAYHIHALDILTGKPAASVAGGKPMEIAAKAHSPTARSADFADAEFTPKMHLNRPGLLLLDGVLYLAFGSQGDIGHYYGWIIAYDAKTLEKLAVHCPALEWGEGGIWQSGNGLAGESVEGPDKKTHHYVYTVVANGIKPVLGEDGEFKVAHPNIPDEINEPFYGNCILKLELLKSDAETVKGRPPTQGEPGTSHRFDVIDWFTTSDCLDLNNLDDDLISGPVLFDATPEGGTKTTMVLGGGKDGRFYLCDRDNLGHWNSMTGGEPAHVGHVMKLDPATGKETPVLQTDANGKQVPVPTWIAWNAASDRQNAILQDDRLCAFHVHGTPVIWKRAEDDVTAFVWSENDTLRAYTFNVGTKKFQIPPQSTSNYRLPPYELRMPGGFLAVSSDGDRPGTGIVWAAHPTDDNAMNKTVKGTLRAYNAQDLSNDLWTSDDEAEGRDRLGMLAKFVPPVVANGKVYMATFSRELVVYGLLPLQSKRQRQGDAGIFESQGFGPGVAGKCIVSCGIYHLTASGPGLITGQDNTVDGFYFAFLDVDADEPGVSIAITVKYHGLQAAPDMDQVFAGLMIRSVGGAQVGGPIITDDNKMPFAALLATPNQKASFLYRTMAGKAIVQDPQSSTIFPNWMRLTAVASVPSDGTLVLTGSVSPDGQEWTVVGPKTVIKMQGMVRVGLAGTGKKILPDPQNPEQMTASFGSLTVTPHSP